MYSINIVKTFQLIAVYGCLLAIGVVTGMSQPLTPKNIEEAIAQVREQLAEDSLRPGYHLTPPAGCMGDPNGGIYYQGKYHIFYGLAPFRPTPGGWYWAHAESEDLLHWEHTPPRHTPAFDLGLGNVGSGSTIVTENGTPLGFYSVGEGGEMKFWRARFDDQLHSWEHPDPNPILTLQHPNLPPYDEFWRDPFVFRTEGRTFMIACADLLESPEVQIPIFEATDQALTEWVYRGVMFSWPKHIFRNFEVPELRPLGDRWILMASADAPEDRTVYFIGDFDPESFGFIPEKQGFLDYSPHYYAQESILDDQNNLFLMAWMPGWDRDWLPHYYDTPLKNNDPLWNGCFALPRKLSLNDRGELIQQPVEVLQQLRGEKKQIEDLEIKVEGPVTAYRILPEIRGRQLEMKATLELGSAAFVGLNLLCNKEGEGGLFIEWSGNMLLIDGVKIPLENWVPGALLDLHIFIDQQQIEVFISGGRYCASRRLPADRIRGDQVSLTSLGGHGRLVKLEAWQMGSFKER